MSHAPAEVIDYREKMTYDRAGVVPDHKNMVPDHGKIIPHRLEIIPNLLCLYTLPPMTFSGPGRSLPLRMRTENAHRVKPIWSQEDDLIS